MMSHFTCQRTITGLMLMLLLTSLTPGQLIPGTLDVANLGDAAIVASGGNVGDRLKVLDAGDFNGDGLSDILLGAPNADGPDNQRLDAGAAYIIFGSPNGIKPRDLGNPDEIGQDVVFYGADSGDRLSLTGISADINGDGIDDIILAAPNAGGPGNARTNTGEVYIFFGGPGLTSGTVRDIAESAGRGPDITIVGPPGGRANSLGASIALGDVNGDGQVDLIVGAPGAFGPQVTRAAVGSVYVIFGGPRLKERGTIDLANPVGGADVTIYGSDPTGNVGFAVKAGDLDHDGIDDLVFSAPTAFGPAGMRRGAGAVYVLFGGPDLGNPVVRDVAGFFGPGVDLTIFGQDIADGLGGSLAIGDVSGDQMNDLIVGALFADGPENTRANAGEVYIILGGPTLRSEGVRDIAAQFGRPADLAMFGGRSGDQFGISLRLAQLSGDGINDIIVGAPLSGGPDNQRLQAGEVYVFFGGPNLINRPQRDVAEQVGLPPDVRLVGPTAGFEFGASFAVADVTNDGVDDLIVGAPFGSAPQSMRPSTGLAFVISGQ